MTAKQFISAFKKGKNCDGSKLITGLCGRISEGKCAKDFEKLSMRAGRRAAFIAGPELLSTFLGKSALQILIDVGIDPNNVLEKVRAGGYYRLFIFPET